MKTTIYPTFQKTKNTVTATANGWDGKSYNGEAREFSVWELETKPGRKFIRIYQSRHYCFLEVTEKIHPVSGANIAEFCTFI